MFFPKEFLKLFTATLLLGLGSSIAMEQAMLRNLGTMAQAQTTQTYKDKNEELYKLSIDYLSNPSDCRVQEALGLLQNALTNSKNAGDTLEEFKALNYLFLVSPASKEKEKSYDYISQIFLITPRLQIPTDRAFKQLFEQYSKDPTYQRIREGLGCFHKNTGISGSKSDSFDNEIDEYLEKKYFEARQVKDEKSLQTSYHLRKLFVYRLTTWPSLPYRYPRTIAALVKEVNIAKEMKDLDYEIALVKEVFLRNYNAEWNMYDRVPLKNEDYVGVVKLLENAILENNSFSRELTHALSMAGDYNSTIKYIERNLSSLKSSKFDYAFALDQLGIAYQLSGNLNKAIAYYKKSLAAKDKTYYNLQDLLSNLGSALLESRNLKDSNYALLSAIQHSENEKNSWTANTAYPQSDEFINIQHEIRPYYLLQKNLVTQNLVLDALEISERGKAYLFKRLLAHLLRHPSVAIPFRASTDLPNVEPLNVKQIREVAKQHKSTLVQYSLIYDDHTYHRAEKRLAELYIWVIKPSGEITFRRVDLKPFQDYQSGLPELIASTRQAVITRSSTTTSLSVGSFVKLKDDLPNWQPWQITATNTTKQTLTLTHPTFEAGVTIDRPITDVITDANAARTKDAQLQKLYQLLIAPIADLLPTDANANVSFMPQGELNLVPFAALQQPDGTYLIEKHTISAAPSIQVLDFTHQQRDRLQKSGSNSSLIVGIPRNAVVVGNPTMPQISTEQGEPPQTLAPLPGAEQEAKNIAQLLNTQPLINSQATKETVVQQMSQAQLIHLATHGISSGWNSQNSAIALAPSGKDNGLLSASEIFRLKLKAQLVVLSACNSGRGRISGDSVIGLARSFIVAGAPSVIVSLWSIPDAPTAELMTDFYRNMQKGQNKAQALRQAMLTTMKIHPTPRDWAAFTLIGEAE